MVKNYNNFLLENVSLSLDMIIDIIKRLKGNEDKELVNKLVNYSDKNGKSVLMSIVQSNNQDLIDYILNFNVDLQHKDKSGKNVLFYCKNMLTFKKFYDKGVDPKAIHKFKEGHKNILHYLSSKNLFNVDIYERLIRDGVDINDKDLYGYSIIAYSVLNKGIVQLLIKNGADISDVDIQSKMFKKLFDAMKWYKSKRTLVISVFKILFENGMEFNMYDFSKLVEDVDSWYSEKIDIVDKLIKPLLKYFNEDRLLQLFKHYIQHSSNNMQQQKFAKRILNLGIYPKIYSYLKDFYRNTTSLNDIFEDYIKKHPYLIDSEKYNL